MLSSVAVEVDLGHVPGNELIGYFVVVCRAVCRQLSAIDLLEGRMNDAEDDVVDLKTKAFETVQCNWTDRLIIGLMRKPERDSTKRRIRRLLYRITVDAGGYAGEGLNHSVERSIYKWALTTRLSPCSFASSSEFM